MAHKIKPDTKHPDYTKNRWAWRLIRDAIEGESAIKRANTTYLPMPSGMLQVETAPQLGPSSVGNTQGIPITPQEKEDYFSNNDPSYHPNPAYKAYKKRAHFPDITANTQRGLMGLVVRGEPDVTLPDSMNYLLTNATKDGKTLSEVYDELVNNQLTQGRFILSMDVDESDGKIKIVMTKADDFINWKKDKRLRNELSLGVFQRDVIAHQDDMFSHTTTSEFVAAYLIDSVFVTQSFDKEGTKIGELNIPNFMGKKLDYVPIVVIGSTRISVDTDIIPMYGIANVSVQMYQKSADLSMSEFMSCNPMLTITGIESEEGPKIVGSVVVLTIANEAAKAYYPNTDTSALQHVMAHIDKLAKEAESYGSNLLNNSAKSEAAETLKIRQFQNGANLLSLVDVAGNAIQQVLIMIGEWMGVDTSKIFFEGNKEFSNIVLSAQEQTAMLQSWMAGGTSQANYLWNLKRAGLLEGTVDDEMKRIESEPPKTPLLPQPNKEVDKKVDEEKDDGNNKE